MPTNFHTTHIIGTHNNLCYFYKLASGEWEIAIYVTMWIKLCTSVNKICKKVNIWIYLCLRSAWRNSAGCYQYMCKYNLTTANDYVVLASKNRIQTWESICQKWDTYSIITRLFSIMDTLFHLLLVVVACVCVWKR